LPERTAARNVKSRSALFSAGGIARNVAHHLAQLGNPVELIFHFGLDTDSEELLMMAINKLDISTRAYDRIFKVSRTIADMTDAEGIRP